MFTLAQGGVALNFFDDLNPDCLDKPDLCMSIVHWEKRRSPVLRNITILALSHYWSKDQISMHLLKSKMQ